MSNIRAGIDPLRVDVTAQFPLGIEVDDPRGGDPTGAKLKYVAFGQNGGVGQAVQLNLAAAVAVRHATVILTTNANECIEGLIVATAVLNGQFGWIMIEGRFENALTAATIVAGAMLRPTANDGELDDTAFTPNDAELQPAFVGRKVRALTTATSNRAAVLITR